MTSGGGQPGDDPQIQMRGQGSLSASSSPLLVVDGAIYSGTYSSINPLDIASMSLLKDATASSLYGARGANGVILITTKRGKGLVTSGKPQINVDLSVGTVNRMLPFYEKMGTKEYMEASFASARRFGINQADDWMSTVLGGYNPYNVPATQLFDANGKIKPEASLKYDDNWFEAVSRTGIRRQFNLSVADNSENSDYYFSLGYNNDPGTIRNSSYERITTLLNVNAKVTPWLTSGLKLSGTYDKQQRFIQQNTAFVNPFFTAQVIAPIYSIYLRDNDGNIQYDANGKEMYDFGNNPQYDQDRHFSKNMNVLSTLEIDDNNNKSLFGSGIMYLEAKIMKDFKLRAELNLDYLTYTGTAYANMLYGDAAAVKGALTRTLQTRYTYTFRQLLSWHPTWGIFGDAEKGHSLDAFVSHESYFLSNQVGRISRTGFTDPEFKEGGAAAVTDESTSYLDEFAMESYIASVSYNFNRKYNFTANFRRDASSRFAPDNRWGNFYSVGGGWVLSEENFLKGKVSWLNTLKLRLSYGVQGNENLGGGSDFYAWMATYYFNPNATTPGYSFNKWGNPDLTWENNEIINPGLDFTLFRGRLFGSFDFYVRNTKDLLWVRPYAPSVGIGGIQDNIGALRNSGLELSVTGKVVATSKFQWDVTLNAQRVINRVTQVQGQSDTLFTGIGIFAKGLANGTYFMPEFAGVQAANDDITGFKGGDELWYISYARDATTGALVRVPDGTKTNDYQVANLVENRKIMGSTWRDLEGSVRNVVSYKNFTLDFLITFGIGGKFFDNVYSTLMQPGNDFQGFGWHKDMERAWTPENPNTDVPRTDLTDANIGNPSDRFLISNSFLKIQNINLSYNLPDKWVKKAGMQSGRIYVSADNVHLFAGRKGLDIQQSLFGTSDFTQYYPYRTIMFGVRLGL
jgi:TonB-linked SusC/RagA family outer membrane protein